MRPPAATTLSRRAVAALAPALLFIEQRLPASAFQNALPEVLDEIGAKKTPGPPPTDIGIKKGGALRPCLDGRPHCFSSSDTVGEYKADTSKIGTGWLVTPWTYKDMSVAGALTDLKKAVDA